MLDESCSCIPPYCRCSPQTGRHTPRRAFYTFVSHVMGVRARKKVLSGVAEVGADVMEVAAHIEKSPGKPFDAKMHREDAMDRNAPL